MQVAAKELLALLAKPSLDGIPLLVLGNKNDLPGALGTQQLIQQLELQVGKKGTPGWDTAAELVAQRQTGRNAPGRSHSAQLSVRQLGRGDRSCGLVWLCAMQFDISRTLEAVCAWL